MATTNTEKKYEQMYIAVCDALGMPSDVPLDDVIQSVKNRDEAHAHRAIELGRLYGVLYKISSEVRRARPHLT